MTSLRWLLVMGVFIVFLMLIATHADWGWVYLMGQGVVVSVAWVAVDWVRSDE